MQEPSRNVSCQDIGRVGHKKKCPIGARRKENGKVASRWRGKLTCPPSREKNGSWRAVWTRRRSTERTSRSAKEYRTGPEEDERCSLREKYHRRWSTQTLFGVRQKDNELLRAFVKRFTNAKLESPYASEDLTMSAFVQGLKESELHTSLIKRLLDLLTICSNGPPSMLTWRR